MIWQEMQVTLEDLDRAITDPNRICESCLISQAAMRHFNKPHASTGITCLTLSDLPEFRGSVIEARLDENARLLIDLFDSRNYKRLRTLLPTTIKYYIKKVNYEEERRESFE